MDTTNQTNLLLLDLPRYLVLMAALIAAIWRWPLYKDSTQRWFLHFIIYSVATEVLGHIVGNYLNRNNSFIFNSYMIISFSFYFHWFGLILKKKKWVYIMFGFFMVSTLYSIIYESFWKDLFHWPFVVGTIFTLLCVSLYFIESLEEKDIVNLQRSQRFWIIAGLTIFHIGFLPILFLGTYMETYGSLYSAVLTLTNVVLYGSYTISFLCLRKK